MKIDEVKRKGVNKCIKLLVYLLLLSSRAIASPPTFSAFKSVPCDILITIGYAFAAVIPTIIMLMFVYGAGKYAFSAEDPSARKQALAIIRSAVIGGALFTLTDTLLNIVKGGSSWWDTCT